MFRRSRRKKFAWFFTRNQAHCDRVRSLFGNLILYESWISLLVWRQIIFWNFYEKLQVEHFFTKIMPIVLGFGDFFEILFFTNRKYDLWCSAGVDEKNLLDFSGKIMPIVIGFSHFLIHNSLNFSRKILPIVIGD